MIRKKKFTRYLINNCYPIAIDGTQKLPFDTLWCEQLLQRKHTRGKSEEELNEPDQRDQYHYYVYVLEANLAFQNGMVIPLLSEFLEFEHGDRENNKQDCEQRAFCMLLLAKSNGKRSTTRARSSTNARAMPGSPVAPSTAIMFMNAVTLGHAIAGG